MMEEERVGGFELGLEEVTDHGQGGFSMEDSRDLAERSIAAHFDRPRRVWGVGG